MDATNDSKLEDILRECTNRGNIPSSDKEKLFENLWKEQSDRLNQHEKYLADSIEIQPIHEFVCKAKMKNKNQDSALATKVFLNICSHHLVPTLSVSQIDINNDGKTEQGIRFPMSSGVEMKVKDQKGNEASAFDVVFHPDIIAHAVKDYQYKMNICLTATQNLSQKHEFVIDGPLKFPNCPYKGTNERPLPQRIRKQGAAKYIQEDDNIKQMIEHAQKDESGVDCDFYIVFVDEKKKKMRLKNGIGGLKKYLHECDEKESLADVAAIQINIDLMDKYDMKQLDLETNGNGICLRFKQEILLDVKWIGVHKKLGKMIKCDGIKAKSIKKKSLLKIHCPLR